MDENLVKAAEDSPVVRRLGMLTAWVGGGRKLTQTGRIGLTDARFLVDHLDTGDTLDPKIGERVFRTTSSQELPELVLAVEWAKAARLVRTAKGRLLAVQKNRPLLADPLALWNRAFEVFPTLGPVICPDGYVESLVGHEFEPVMTELLAGLYAGPLTPAQARTMAWERATAPYRIEGAPPEIQQALRRTADRDTTSALHVLVRLGALGWGETAELTPLGRRAMRRRLGEPEPGDPVYQITITLRDVDDPPLWRRLLVSAGIGLDRLHSVIQAAMGWRDCHLHMFEAGDVRYGDPDPELGFRDERSTTLGELVQADVTTIGYTYDFGDDWEHEIVVERALTAVATEHYPRCLDGAGACPPEDCGGPPGYEHVREVVADPDDPEHEEMVVWLGLDAAAEFTPERFDPREVDLALVRGRSVRQ